MAPEPVNIIGIGPEGRAGLSQVICETIMQADELWGSDRLLQMWPDLRNKKIPLGKQLTAELAQLNQRPAGQKVVILASGDPGFYGIAASILKILPIEEVLVYPQVSFLQAAFARIRIPWHEAALISAHARPVAEVIGLARRFPKLGILTDPVQTPAWIAEKLLAAGIPDCRAVIIENLGGKDEKIIDVRLTELPALNLAPLNVMLLVHDAGWKPMPVYMPRPDSAYQHRNGLITKSDVRMMSIGRLGICETDTIWDIGAGSGAVSIEMAEIAWRGRVFAIEKDADCLDCLCANVAHFGTANVIIMQGEAPQILEDAPAPTAVFIGGSSGKLVEILSQIEHKAQSGCRIVANFTLLENMVLAYTWMKDHHWAPILTEARFSYGAPIGNGTRLIPANPVFILSGLIQTVESPCTEN